MKIAELGISLRVSTPHYPIFNSGDFVMERGSDIRGHVVGEGEYPGEWRVRLMDGSETACLADNLALGSPSAPAHPAKRRVNEAD